MFAFLYVLLLLLSPFEPSPDCTATPAEWAALKSLALDLEVVGHHEHWVPDFHSETRYVWRYARVLADAPPLCEAERFPTEDASRDAIHFGEAFEAHCRLQSQLTPHAAAAWDAAAEDTRHRLAVWQLACSARRAENDWVCRRRSLARLREALGPEAWGTGVMPLPVDLRYFREIDR